MTPSSLGDDIALVIQLSVAPVFLLVAVGSILNVLTQRLGRVVDRARTLENALLNGEAAADRMHEVDELRVLDRRMTYCHWSINLCVVAALLIAFIVGVLFASHVAGVGATWLVAGLFAGAMACIVVGLCAFLLEIALATRTVRVRSELLISED